MLAITGLLGASLGGARVPVPECFKAASVESLSPELGEPKVQLVGFEGEPVTRPTLGRGGKKLVRTGGGLVGTAGDVACFLSRRRGTGFIPTDKSPRPPMLFLTVTLGSCSG